MVAESVEDARRQLQRLCSRAYRDRTRAFRVEGVAAFLQASRAGVRFEFVLWSPILLRLPNAQKEIRLLKQRGVKVFRVSPEVFRSVAENSRASGVVAVGRQRWTSLDRLSLRPGRIAMGLESVRSTGNVGSLLRTADFAGVHHLILFGDAVDPYDPGAIRSSMGAGFHFQFTRVTVPQFQKWAADSATVVGTSARGGSVGEFEVAERPLVVLFGDERTGLSPEARSLCDRMLCIENHGHGSSLNVAVAAGVVLLGLRPVWTSA